MALFENLNRKKTGILPYILLLILAIIILFLISYTSFKQNRALRQSTEMVSNTQEIINEINLMYGSYTGSESAGIKYLISKDSSYLSPIIGFRDMADMSFKRLTKLTADNSGQQQLLNRVPGFRNTLFKALRPTHPKTAGSAPESQFLTDRMYAIESQLDSLEVIKTQMIAAEYDLLEQRKAAYRSDMTITPSNILYLSLFTLGILMFTFSKINSDRKKIDAIRAFLQNVLQNTNNIINYLEPIHNKAGRVIDFRVSYTNVQGDGGIGAISKNANGRKLTEVYPVLINKDSISFLTKALIQKKTISRVIDYDIDGKKMWIDTSATPFANGISTTTRNITHEKEAQLQLIDLNTKLESQNIELERTGSFLKNMLGTIHFIVSYFEAVRDRTGSIVDFKIAYTNYKIIDVTGRTAKEITGKLISQEYPAVFENGDFERFLQVVASDKSIETEQEYHLGRGVFYLCNEIQKLGDGVTIVSQDVTLRKEAERKLEAASERLAIQNTVLNDAELVAGVCSYSYNLSTQTVTYSDNCFRLLEIEPKKSADSIDIIATSIHPDDKKRYQSNRVKAQNERKSVRQLYRLKTDSGELKDILLQNHLFEKNGERFMVGIIRDITQEVTNEHTLRRHNRDLERSNAELESFNRVVSHDLQEPLRKIQMFISRFSESDRKHLSESGQNYLGKIDVSANRMQLLIRNLLSYARLINELESPQKIDLDRVFDKVCEDLSEKIEETKAKIDITGLPAIYGTEFQLEQLFNNLLSNSIKYKKTDRTPTIKVTGKILPFHSVDSRLNLSKSKYVLVTISDNGIGFESQQNEKIFGLFQRLHKKHAYEGIGLGLAICKKIVENHDGCIVAHSEPGKGTRMEIYLPFRE